MNASKRPVSIWIIACVYLALGCIGLAYHFRELRQPDGIWGWAYRIPGNSLRSIYAPGPQLGTLACARLDRIPCNPQRLPCAPWARHTLFNFRGNCLVSFPPRGQAVFSRCGCTVLNRPNCDDVGFAAGVIVPSPSHSMTAARIARQGAARTFASALRHPVQRIRSLL
jgi:hypothetical protein